MKHLYPTFITIIALGISLTGCERFNQSNQRTTSASATEFVTKIEPQNNDGSIGLLLPDFSELVVREGESVVNIQAVKEQDNNPHEEDIYFDFFKRLIPNPTDDSEYGINNDSNFGSGLIITQDGYILTNAHVVKGLDSIKVTLNDRRDYQAKLIGFDEKSDIAVLKIDANNLPAAKIGNPNELKVGEWVAAIGAPFGFDNSVTAGIVSAKNRALPDDNYTPFIQTDVAINPGNSGGPLYNLKGEVIGINSQIYSRSGGFMGISFAIPIDMAMNVYEQIKTKGKVERGQIGIVIQEVNYNLAKSFGLDKPNGALINRVIPNSPAAKAGLQAGDIIQQVSKQPIHTSSDLPIIIGALPPGTEVPLTIWRNKQQITLPITLGSSSNNYHKSSIKTNESSDSIGGFENTATGLAISIQENNGKEKLAVFRSEGAAAKAGIRRGDIILEINHQPVQSQSDFEKALKSSGKNIPILIERNDSNLFIALVIP